MSLVEKLFGSFSDRELKKINPNAKQVLAQEEKYAAMPDADLQAQTADFKQQLAKDFFNEECMIKKGKKTFHKAILG